MASEAIHPAQLPQNMPVDTLSLPSESGSASTSPSTLSASASPFSSSSSSSSSSISAPNHQQNPQSDQFNNHSVISPAIHSFNSLANQPDGINSRDTAIATACGIVDESKTVQERANFVGAHIAADKNSNAMEDCTAQLKNDAQNGSYSAIPNSGSPALCVSVCVPFKSSAQIDRAESNNAAMLISEPALASLPLQSAQLSKRIIAGIDSGSKSSPSVGTVVGGNLSVSAVQVKSELTNASAAPSLTSAPVPIPVTIPTPNIPLELNQFLQQLSSSPSSAVCAAAAVSGVGSVALSASESTLLSNLQSLLKNIHPSLSANNEQSNRVKDLEAEVAKMREVLQSTITLKQKHPVALSPISTHTAAVVSTNSNTNPNTNTTSNSVVSNSNSSSSSSHKRKRKHGDKDKEREKEKEKEKKKSKSKRKRSKKCSDDSDDERDEERDRDEEDVDSEDLDGDEEFNAKCGALKKCDDDSMVDEDIETVQSLIAVGCPPASSAATASCASACANLPSNLSAHERRRVLHRLYDRQRRARAAHAEHALKKMLFGANGALGVKKVDVLEKAVFALRIMSAKLRAMKEILKSRNVAFHESELESLCQGMMNGATHEDCSEPPILPNQKSNSNGSTASNGSGGAMPPHSNAVSSGNIDSKHLNVPSPVDPSLANGHNSQQSTILVKSEPNSSFASPTTAPVASSGVTSYASTACSSTCTQAEHGPPTSPSAVALSALSSLSASCMAYPAVDSASGHRIPATPVSHGHPSNGGLIPISSGSLMDYRQTSAPLSLMPSGYQRQTSGNALAAATTRSASNTPQPVARNLGSARRHSLSNAFHPDESTIASSASMHPHAQHNTHSHAIPQAHAHTPSPGMPCCPSAYGPTNVNVGRALYSASPHSSVASSSPYPSPADESAQMLPPSAHGYSHPSSIMAAGANISPSGYPHSNATHYYHPPPNRTHMLCTQQLSSSSSNLPSTITSLNTAAMPASIPNSNSGVAAAASPMTMTLPSASSTTSLASASLSLLASSSAAAYSTAASLSSSRMPAASRPMLMVNGLHSHSHSHPHGGPFIKMSASQSSLTNSTASSASASAALATTAPLSARRETYSRGESSTA